MTRRDFDDHQVRILAHQFRNVIGGSQRPFTHSNVLRLMRQVYRQLRRMGFR